MLNFNLTKEEFNTLANRYKTEDPEFMINYKNFCASINSAFTTYGIQKDPTAKVAPVTVNNTLLARRKYLIVKLQARYRGFASRRKSFRLFCSISMFQVNIF